MVLVMLAASLLASFAQFHAHDCHGHAEFLLGGNLTSHLCHQEAAGEHHETSGGEIFTACGHENCTGACALHLSAFEEPVSVRIMPEIYYEVATLTDSFPEIATINSEEKVWTVDNCFTLAYSECFNFRANPLRGSPGGVEIQGV